MTRAPAAAERGRAQRGARRPDVGGHAWSAGRRRGPAGSRRPARADVARMFARRERARTHARGCVDQGGRTRPDARDGNSPENTAPSEARPRRAAWTRVDGRPPGHVGLARVGWMARSWLWSSRRAAPPGLAPCVSARRSWDGWVGPPVEFDRAVRSAGFDPVSSSVMSGGAGADRVVLPGGPGAADPVTAPRGARAWRAVSTTRQADVCPRSAPRRAARPPR